MSAHEDVGLPTVKDGPPATAASSSLKPNPLSKLTVDDLTYSELDRHYVRLGRLCKTHKAHFWERIEWAAVFGGLSVLFFGGSVGGAVALIPFLATDPTHRDQVEYYVVIGVATFISILCLVGRMAIKKEQLISIDSEYEEFGVLISRYADELKQQEQQAAAARITSGEAVKRRPSGR